MREILHVENIKNVKGEIETDNKQVSSLPSQLRKVSSVSLKTTSVK